MLVNYVADHFYTIEMAKDGDSGTQIDSTPRAKHNTKQQGKDIPKSGSLDTTGEENSSTDLLDEAGNLKQRRYYDEQGRAERDVDFSHSNGDGIHTFPHEHTWDWSNPNKPVRSK